MNAKNNTIYVHLKIVNVCIQSLLFPRCHGQFRNRNTEAEIFKVVLILADQIYFAVLFAFLLKVLE